MGEYMAARRIIEEIAANHGVPVAFIRRGRKTRHAVELRREVVNKLLENTSLSLYEVGIFVGLKSAVRQRDKRSGG